MELKPAFKQINETKSLFNIGACFDIPTGYWVKGRYGEWILMGGLGPMTAIVGPGNMFKSTMLHYQLLSAMAKIFAYKPTTCSSYDSESNIHLSRLRNFSKRFPVFENIDLLDEGYWTVSDASQYLADEWYAILRKFMKEKRKNAKSLTVTLPYDDKHGNPVTELFPTFSEYDSISAMALGTTEDIMDKNEIGASSGSHLFMREGLGKAQLLHETPSMCAAANHVVLSTAHIGPNMAMSSGPGTAPPKKQLQFLNTDTKIKGVTGQFLYLQQNLWMVNNSKLLWQDDKTPKWPKVQGEAIVGDVDLNEVTVQHLRGKAGPSGWTLQIIVSQDEGVLPTMTEFNFLKSQKFGFDGNDMNYSLTLLPDVKLSRTTVRMKVDSEPKLRRAMNITSELAQMHIFHRQYLKGDLMDATELYTKVKENGYDWDFILENTRGWWTYDNEKVAEYFLSTRDLIEMAKGTYHPYWLEADKKTIKKQFKRH